MTVWTIGHSTRSRDDFAAILDAYAIEAVVDVRRFPGSRRLPQFNSEALARDLARHGIDYRSVPALGGRRRSSGESPSTAWRHPAFRAYAEYALTEEFADGLFELMMIAGGLRTAIMCAEVLWWRCHRRIIADILTSIGAEVEHIRDTGPAERHRLSPPARLVGGRLSYAPVRSSRLVRRGR
jgi:uncharacterized protein (DUF488 family)